MNSQTYPLISIIVPVYNGQSFIARCIEALLDQTYDADKMEIIIVDNGSSDNTAGIVGSYPVEYVYYDAQKGPSPARNAGVEAAKGEYLIFVDADCLADRHMAAKHIGKHLELKSKNSNIRLIGGAVGGANTNFWSHCDDLASWYLFHPALKSRVEKTLLPSGNMSIEKSFLHELGGFNRGLRYGEDIYICYQVQQMGYELYFLSSAIVYHINRTTFGGFMKRAKEYANIEFGLISNTNLIKKKSNFLLSFARQGYHFVYKFGELCAYICRSKRLLFFPAFPFILINKLYFGYHRIIKQLRGPA